MKLKDGFITYDTDDEQVMVSTGSVKFAGLVRSNRTGAFIIDCLKKDTTVEEIVSAMTEKFDAPAGVIRADVEKVLETLRSIGAIQE